MIKFEIVNTGSLHTVPVTVNVIFVFPEVYVGEPDNDPQLIVTPDPENQL